MNIDSIGFDLDGTLWNSVDKIAEAWAATAQKHNVHIPSKEEIEGVLGLNKFNLMNKLFPDMDHEKQMIFFDEAESLCRELLAENGGILFDGVEETLAQLSKDYKLYIVSNCQDGYIEAFYQAHKLDKYFCDFEHPDERCLPKGVNIRTLLDRNGFKNSIFVGDTQGDAEAAKYAGLPFIYASFGFGEVKNPDYTINNFREITDIIK